MSVTPAPPAVDHEALAAVRRAMELGASEIVLRRTRRGTYVVTVPVRITAKGGEPKTAA